MLRNNTVIGLNFSRDDSLFTCETCATGKFASIPFPEQGKLQIRSARNLTRRYMRTNADTITWWWCSLFSHIYGWLQPLEVYFLKHKSEVSSKFLEYKCYAETQTKWRIKALQPDNGGEFCNVTIDSILKEFEIWHRLSTPHCHKMMWQTAKTGHSLNARGVC